MGALAGRFSIAFSATNFLTWDVDWTALDQEHPSLVTSYSIDRGRQFELDRTDGGRATVELADVHGILDPTNVTGPYFGLLEPMLPAAIASWNPITEDWHPRFRGFVESFDYAFDPSQRVNRLTLSLVDIFEILQTIEMQPGEFGTPVPVAADDPYGAGVVKQGDVYFVGDLMKGRLQEVLAQTPVPEDWFVLFTGNVWVRPTAYSPGESVMTAVQEAVDAEFPGVGNAYPDRFGRLAVHGRWARFNPEGVEASTTPDRWQFREFSAGDGAAVAADPTVVAQIRRFSFNRGLSKVINYALATPARNGGTALKKAELDGQLVMDSVSIGRYGIRSWSAQDLLTYGGKVDEGGDGIDGGSTALVETQRFAQFYADNYATPRNRVTEITFRSMRPEAVGAERTWNLLCRCDIADACSVTLASPGGGLFDDEDFFIEGVHEECRPLNPDYDDISVSLDLSPRGYFTGSIPFPEPPDFD